MEKSTLFFSEQDPLSLRYLVIEEIDNSIWAYLTFPNSTTIEKDCFLANRTKLNGSINLEKLSEQGITPPISDTYATEFSDQPNLEEEDISVEWINEEVILMLHIKGKPFYIFWPMKKMVLLSQLVKMAHMDIGGHFNLPNKILNNKSSFGFFCAHATAYSESSRIYSGKKPSTICSAGTPLLTSS